MLDRCLTLPTVERNVQSPTIARYVHGIHRAYTPIPDLISPLFTLHFITSRNSVTETRASWGSWFDRRLPICIHRRARIKPPTRPIRLLFERNCAQPAQQRASVYKLLMRIFDAFEEGSSMNERHCDSWTIVRDVIMTVITLREGMAEIERDSSKNGDWTEQEFMFGDISFFSN